ncbi:MAG: choice-of-anchor tandem repeat GloVer-containing protein [Terriglobales bacterium]
MTKLDDLKIAMVFLFCVAMAVAAPAQTFTVIKHFNGINGDVPTAPLVQGLDGNLYGTTYAGGSFNNGTVFRITTAGDLTSLHSFCASAGCPDGSTPDAGLVLGGTGFFYGVTQVGGANTIGTIFQIGPKGKLTTLYSFCPLTNCPDGAQPTTALIQGSDGNLYGTAMDGGANGNFGTVFRFKLTNPSGLTVLHSFCALAGCTDGGIPLASLVQGTGGKFYGSTETFGAQNGGTIFQMTAHGTLTTIYTFCSLASCADGNSPQGRLIQATNGDFYGTTSRGGTSTNCNGGCGTAFKITSQGILNTLHSFNLSDGWYPIALMQGTDGNFYGTTYQGGAFNKGTVFQMTRGGKVTTLRSLSGSDGIKPEAPLMQATDGNFYGTTAFTHGTVFRLSMGLGPFVKLLPAVGQVGSVVQILGNNLTGSTRVTFNGVPSTNFIVVSATLIYANVPTGATTGPVRVKTPSGTLKSNVPYRVNP